MWEWTHVATLEFKGAYVYMYACPVCSAVVMSGAKEDHQEWHLRRGETPEGDVFFGRDPFVS